MEVGTLISGGQTGDSAIVPVRISIWEMKYADTRRCNTSVDRKCSMCGEFDHLFQSELTVHDLKESVRVVDMNPVIGVFE